ncbi:MAG: signal recognition particle subunit SRP54 [Alphaproteobacteria bacterium]|nr:signal recognition particle subunit SRP54 [Alphaproteobacteria bacterium]
MFETLSDRLSTIFDALRKQAALSEADVDAALREVRRALLEADVALPVARDFIARVRTRAVGQEVIKSITPGQMVIKIVHDNLVEMLGSTSQGIDLNAPSPVPVLMVGLQGSGKTTTTAKLALRFQTRDRKKVLMASLSGVSQITDKNCESTALEDWVSPSMRTVRRSSAWPVSDALTNPVLMRAGAPLQCEAFRLAATAQQFVSAPIRVTSESRAQRRPRPGDKKDSASSKLVLPAPFSPVSTTGRPSRFRLA